MRTWVDASTLIALDAAGEVRVLRDLLGRVTVSREVEAEVFSGRESRDLREARGAWIEVVEVRGDRRRWEALGLGRGEASLFLTPRKDRLVLDEVPARTVAESEGRDYVGLLGLLMGGVRAGKLLRERAIEVLRGLLRSGFRLSADLYDAVLRDFERAEGDP
jgi:predicted nucleic acid-binding protein